jgi:hypothetical protein
MVTVAQKQKEFNDLQVAQQNKEREREIEIYKRVVEEKHAATSK